MTFLIVFTYLILLLIIRKKVNDQISRRLVFVYVTYWCASLFLCRINPFDFFEVSDVTYVLLLLHLVTFMIGFIIFKPTVQKDIYNLSIQSVGKIVRNKLFIVSYIICIIFILVLFYRQRMLLAIYTMSEMRGDFMDMILENNKIAYFFYNTIATGMFHFVLCLIGYMFLFERKWKYIVFLSLYPLIWAIVSGGRNQFMAFGFYGFSMWLIADYWQSVKNGYKSLYKISFKGKLFLLSFVVCMFLGMTIVTFLKNSTGKIDKDAIIESMSDLGMNFGEYSAGPIVAFDSGLHNRTYSKQWYYGAATFSGTDYLLYVLLRQFGFQPTASIDTTTSLLQNDIIPIAPDRNWNYAYTSCMHYYFDFGVWGIVLLPILFGFLTRTLIMKLYNSLNIYNIAIVTFVSFCLYMTVFSGYLHKMITLLYIFVLLVLSKYQKRLV